MRRACLALLLGCALAAGDGPLPAALASAAIDGEVLHANTLEVSGLVFRDVTAKPRLADGVLAFLDVEAKAYRGRVQGWYAIDLTPARRGHRCEFKATGLDLAVLARSLGAANEQIAGNLEGWFEATLPIGAAPGTGRSGRGQIDIRDGTLSVLPLLTDFLIGNPFAARGKDSLTARFRLDDAGIELLWLRLDSPAIRLAAHGRIGYDGTLQIEMSPRPAFEVFNRIPLLGDLVANGLSRLTSRTRVYVRGHISQAVVVFDAFGG